MYKIDCSNCDEANLFENLSDKPESCANCLEPLEKLEVQQIPESEIVETDTQETDRKDELPEGLTLIYQKTNEKINIENVEKVELGRESFGSEVLKVPQISGIHCLIEFTDNQYKITDLDSRNGTYAGISKIDCKKNPQQILNNGDLVFLGKEPFLVQLHFEAQPSVEADETSAQHDNEIVSGTDQSDNRKSVIYRCKNCGKDYDHKMDICEAVCRECGTYNEWEEII